MVKRSKIVGFPAAVKAWLDQALLDGNFSGYKELEAELRSRGYAIGKSAIHRYGAALERKLAAMKTSTEAAIMLQQNAPDDANAQSAAVIGMVQSEIFNILVTLREMDAAEDPIQRAKLLSTLAKNVATLGNASILQRKWEAENRDRVKAAADVVAKIGAKGGLTKAAVESIRREILGIVG